MNVAIYLACLHIAVAVSNGPSPGPLAGIGVADGLTKVFCDEPFTGPRSGLLELALARNEYEACQLVLIAGAQPVERVRLEFSDLAGPGGKPPITAANLRYNFVAYGPPTTITAPHALKARNLQPPALKRWPDVLLAD